MNLKQQALWSVATSGFHRLSRASATLFREEPGVTSIEYALLASLIAVAALASITLLGGGVDGIWIDVASTVAAAM